MRAGLRVIPMQQAHVKDCEAIVAGSDPWKRLGESVDFRAAIRRNGTNTKAYVGIIGGETAGFILFIPEPVFARGGYLRAVGVAPRFRGRGVGGKLLAFAEKMAARRSSNFFLCASSFNRAAQAFYRQCGYRKAGRLQDLIAPGSDEYIFWKRLSKSRQPARRKRP